MRLGHEGVDELDIFGEAAQTHHCIFAMSFTFQDWH
jgi:hypothetical protein